MVVSPRCRSLASLREALSMSGRKLPLRNHEGEIRGGFRSVYNVRPEYYQELFDRGLLTKPPQTAA